MIYDFDIPLVMVQLGSFVANPFQTFVISLLLAGLFWGLGRLLWKITVAYVKAVSHEKEKFNNLLISYAMKEKRKGDS